MSDSESKLATAKTMLSTVASVAAAAMVVRSMANDFLPHEIRDYLSIGIRTLFNRFFSSHITLVIEEFDGLAHNQIYAAADLYLGRRISSDVHRLRVTKPEKETNMIVTVERDEEIQDEFEGVKIKWIMICREVQSRGLYNPHDINSTLRSESRSYRLTFHKRHKEAVIHSYLPHILRESKSLTQENKALRIFTVDPDNMYGNMSNAWTSVNLDHPATFDTLAMDSQLKKTVLEDLERFVRSREYYRKVGKAWKRGYLLYGPPGTGKSSLIAAMANYLRFDVYDLELTEIRNNSGLRRLLIATANRSILVVEDIDCTIELQDRLLEASRQLPPGYHQENQVTLSGFLNFVDGLWSSCGDERIIIFTTNHKDKLDPALLRPGRMDLHIHMSYCTPCGFRLLATNYLGVKDHPLFRDIETLIQSTNVTPAEVAEQLLKNEDPDAALAGVIEFLNLRRRENEEAAAADKKEDQDPAPCVTENKENNG